MGVIWCQDGSSDGVYGQVFGSFGNKLGSEFRVNTYITNAQRDPSVASLPGGGFVVTWESYGQDGSEGGVYGRRFSCSCGASKDELVLNFGPDYGLYHYDQAGGWKQWNTVNPSQMVTVDLNGDGTDELVAAFPGYGLHTYDSTNGWQLINTVIPEGVISFHNGIACDFGAAYGLWSYSKSGGWVQFNAADPDKIVAVDIDDDSQDELVVSFSGYGLYYFDETNGWQSLNTVVPVGMKPINFYP